MVVLAFGVLLFAGLHLLAAFPQLKERAKARIGAAAYGPVYGLLSIIALAVMVIGWRISEFVPVYEPPSWGWHANLTLMFFAFFSLSVFLFRGRLRQVLRFPMGIAVVLWATGHLLANGDRASLILFGGLLAYALLHMAAGLANGVRPSPEVRAGHDIASFFAGMALYVGMTQLHPILIGVPVLTLVK